MSRLILLLTAVLQLPCLIKASPLAEEDSWPGWKGIKNMFIFGDSYSTTGFDLTSDQPSDANPMGNPNYPGFTSSNGPNWVDFLTTTYNQSRIYTVNLAYGGAVVDNSLVTPYLPTVVSLKGQIQDEFLPNYNQTNSKVAWSTNSTLFGLWIGINDVGNTYKSQNSSLYDSIFSEYSALVDQLYQSGARNFLFINVPPVQRSPGTTAQGNKTIDQEASVLKDFNRRVQRLSFSLRRRSRDANAFHFDSYSMFNRILDAPKNFSQTAGLENTTAYCQAYENGTLTWYSYTETCGVSVDKYFWLNSLHPTFPVHNATAAAIVEVLGQNRSRRGGGGGRD